MDIALGGTTVIRFALLIAMLFALSADGASQQMLMRRAWASRGAEVSAIVVPNGLVGFWRFNDAGLGTAVDSAGTNNGSVVGSPIATNGVKEVSSSAYWLNGSSQHIRPANLFNFSASAGFSVSSWIKLGSSGGTRVIATDSWVAAGNIKSWLLYIENANKPKFFIGDGITATAITGSDALSINVWKHIVVTFSNTTAIIYVDSVVKASGDVGIKNGPFSASGYGYCMGASYNTSGSTFVNYFYGGLDEIRVYNRMLSSNDVVTIYNAEKP